MIGGSRILISWGTTRRSTVELRPHGAGGEIRTRTLSHMLLRHACLPTPPPRRSDGRGGGRTRRCPKAWTLDPVCLPTPPLALVRKVGLEPTRFRLPTLNRARLPVPPLPLVLEDGLEPPRVGLQPTALPLSYPSMGSGGIEPLAFHPTMKWHPVYSRTLGALPVGSPWKLAARPRNRARRGQAALQEQGVRVEAEA